MLKFVYTLTLFVLTATIANANSLKPFEDKNSKLFGFKDTKGKVVVKPQFQIVMKSDNTAEALIPVLKDGHWFRMDAKGHLKFETVFFDNGPDYFEDGLARFLKDGKVGFHNRSGDVMIEAKYDFATPFKEGYSRVCKGCWGSEPEGKKYKPLSSSATHELAATSSQDYMDVVGGNWGIINIQGKEVVPLEYTSTDEAEQQLQK